MRKLVYILLTITFVWSNEFRNDDYIKDLNNYTREQVLNKVEKLFSEKLPKKIDPVTLLTSVSKEVKTNTLKFEYKLGPTKEEFLKASKKTNEEVAESFRKYNINKICKEQGLSKYLLSRNIALQHNYKYYDGNLLVKIDIQQKDCDNVIKNPELKEKNLNYSTKDYNKDFGNVSPQAIVKIFSKAIKKNLPIIVDEFQKLTDLKYFEYPPTLQYINTFNFTKKDWESSMNEDDKKLIIKHIEDYALKKACYKDSILYYMLSRGISLNFEYEFSDFYTFYKFKIIKEECNILQ